MHSDTLTLGPGHTVYDRLCQRKSAGTLAAPHVRQALGPEASWYTTNGFTNHARHLCRIVSLLASQHERTASKYLFRVHDIISYRNLAPTGHAEEYGPQTHSMPRDCSLGRRIFNLVCRRQSVVVLHHGARQTSSQRHHEMKKH